MCHCLITGWFQDLSVLSGGQSYRPSSSSPSLSLALPASSSNTHRALPDLRAISHSALETELVANHDSSWETLDQLLKHSQLQFTCLWNEHNACSGAGRLKVLDDSQVMTQVPAGTQSNAPVIYVSFHIRDMFDIYQDAIAPVQLAWTQENKKTYVIFSGARCPMSSKLAYEKDTCRNL